MPKLVLDINIYMKQMTSTDAILDAYCRSGGRVKLCHNREKDIISNEAEDREQTALLCSQIWVYVSLYTYTSEHSKINFAAQNSSQYELDKSKTTTMSSDLLSYRTLRLTFSG